MFSSPKIWKLKLVLASCCSVGLGAARLGKGQEWAGPCCVEAVCAAILGGAMEDAAAADARALLQRF